MVLFMGGFGTPAALHSGLIVELASADTRLWHSWSPREARRAQADKKPDFAAGSLWACPKDRLVIVSVDRMPEGLREPLGQAKQAAISDARQPRALPAGEMRLE